MSGEISLMVPNHWKLVADSIPGVPVNPNCNSALVDNGRRCVAVVPNAWRCNKNQKLWRSWEDDDDDDEISGFIKQVFFELQSNLDLFWLQHLAMFRLMPDLFSRWNHKKWMNRIPKRINKTQLKVEHQTSRKTFLFFERKTTTPWKLQEKKLDFTSFKPGSEESLVRAVSRSSRADCCNAGCALFLMGFLGICSTPFV